MDNFNHLKALTGTETKMNYGYQSVLLWVILAKYYCVYYLALLGRYDIPHIFYTFCYRMFKNKYTSACTINLIDL